MGVKRIQITVDEQTYEELKAVKGDRPWDTAIVEEFGLSDE